MKKILVTGASGFIGKKICESLIFKNYDVIAAVRNSDKISQNLKNTVISGDINVNTSWSNSLKNIDCIIHCIEKQQTKNKKSSLQDNRNINLSGKRNLEEQAVKEGVKRSIFISSIKVNGEKTLKNFSFKHDDKPMPQNNYAISKLEAEQLLLEISRKSSLEVVIIRPPLVYGPNVKGNFLRLIKLAYNRIPLPILSIKNSRSMVGLDNLVDLISHCINHKSASGEVFLVSDGQDLSTPEIVKKLGLAMGKPKLLIPIPIFILKFLFYIFGKTEELDRLLGSLKLDCSHTINLLNWRPPNNTDENILKTAKWYLKKND